MPRRLLRLLRDLAVALTAVGACVALYRLGIMAFLEAALPLSETQFTVLRRTGVTAFLFLGYLLVARFHEKRPVTELAFRPAPIALGLLSGVLLIALPIAALFALGHFRLVSTRGISTALPVLSLIFLGVVFEEVIFRGVVFRLLEKHGGTVVALTVQALIFGALHLFNEGTTPVTFLSVTLLGGFWGLIFVRSRNLWTGIANHGAWNAVIFLSGVPLSGQETWRASTPLVTAQEGPTWLTGGSFGPEDSVLTLLVLAPALAWLARSAWVHGCFVGAGTERP